MREESSAARVQCEVTPLTDIDLFVLLDNYKAKFDYPVHYHSDYELNLVIGASGNRIVGDSIEPYNDIDLVLIGPRVPHAWRGETSSNTRVITLQFDEEFANTSIASKRVFRHINEMLVRSSSGIRFTGEVVDIASEILFNMCKSQSFNNVLRFYDLLNALSTSPKDSQLPLASPSFDSSNLVRQSKSRRIEKICNYIEQNYNQNITLDDIAELANMSTSAVSHFFKKRTSRTFSNYLTDIRIGHAARLLIETTRSINDIAFDCGFGNISNFNRVFKRYKNTTPREYRSAISNIITKY